MFPFIQKSACANLVMLQVPDLKQGAILLKALGGGGGVGGGGGGGGGGASMPYGHISSSDCFLKRKTQSCNQRNTVHDMLNLSVCKFQIS